MDDLAPEYIAAYRPRTGTGPAEAIEVYRVHASTPRGRIARLAGAAAQGDPTVAPAFAALVTELLAAL